MNIGRLKLKPKGSSASKSSGPLPPVQVRVAQFFIMFKSVLLMLKSKSKYFVLQHITSINAQDIVSHGFYIAITYYTEMNGPLLKIDTSRKGQGERFGCRKQNSQSILRPSSFAVAFVFGLEKYAEYGLRCELLLSFGKEHLEFNK